MTFDNRAFIKKFLERNQIDYEPADASVGIFNDAWIVDTNTLNQMLDEYTKTIAAIMAKAG